MTLWKEALNPPAKFGGHRCFGSGDKIFLIYHVTSRHNVFKGLFLIVNYHFPKYSSHKSCVSSDTEAKIFYVTLQNHVIKGSGDFMEGDFMLFIYT